ncbi:MAG TPA: hypothetical protein VJQ06_09270 [Rhizomicrobium sp.]|nr:hypothetical protein [Rhizomicrobium sp.]
MRIFTFVVAITFLGLSFLTLPLVWAAPSARTAEAPTRAGTRSPEAGPLKSGRTAGVKVAQQARAGLALIGTGAIIAVVVVAAGSGGGQNTMQIASATTTSP